MSIKKINNEHNVRLLLYISFVHAPFDTIITIIGNQATQTMKYSDLYVYHLADHETITLISSCHEINVCP